MIGAPKVMFEPFYHFNSRASHHVIVDLVNMPLSQPYKGNDQLVVSNGKDIFISSIFSTFPTRDSSKKQLFLKKILHVPSINKNLLSVAQFSKGNYVYFEFHSHSCSVKDKETHKELLKGTLLDGLYVFKLDMKSSLASVSSLCNSSQMFVNATTTSIPTLLTDFTNGIYLWHQCLAHASVPIVKKPLSLVIYLFFHSKIGCLIYSSCQIGKFYKMPFLTSSNCSTEPLGIIHFDIWMFPVTSKNGYKYYVHFTMNGLDLHGFIFLNLRWSL